jgi:hypothetical protein
MLTTRLVVKPTRTAVSHFSTSAASRMPIYVCHCPDYPNALEKRLSVRDEHLKRAGQDKEDGVSRKSLLAPGIHPLTPAQRFPSMHSTLLAMYLTV